MLLIALEGVNDIAFMRSVSSVLPTRARRFAPRDLQRAGLLFGQAGASGNQQSTEQILAGIRQWAPSGSVV